MASVDRSRWGRQSPTRGTDQEPPRIRSFLTALFADHPRRLAWVVLVQMAAALSQGVGLLLLIPVLQVAGVDNPPSPGGPVTWSRSLFDALGIPLTLRWVLAAYVAIVVTAAALTAHQSVLLTRYRLGFVDRLRSRLYAAVARAEWRHLLGLRQSDLLASLTVGMAWVSQGTLAVLRLITAVLLIAVQLMVATQISLPITALAAGTGAALTALVWPLVRRSRRLGRELLERNKEVMGTVTGFLDGLKLAKAHGLESRHLDTFDDAIRRTRRSEVEFAKASALAAGVQVVVTAVVLAVLVVLAMERLHTPLAELLVLALIFMRLVPQITSTQHNMQAAAQALPSFEDVMTTIKRCEGANEGPVDATGAVHPTGIGSGIRLEHVSFAYSGGGPEVLKDVSVAVPARRTTALVGPSGAGKTTVADLAVGLLVPTSGAVLVDGKPLVGERLRGWRLAVGMVSQDPFLFHGTVRDNLMWARPDADEEEVWRALQLAAASQFVSGLPQGIDTVVGDRGVRLSGGERQRVALARAVLRRPELLVLDEATSSLDNEHELAIRTALVRLQGQLTMLVIAHRLSTVSHADSIVVIDGGRLVEVGTWAELSLRERGRLRSLIEAGAFSPRQ